MKRPLAVTGRSDWEKPVWGKFSKAGGRWDRFLSGRPKSKARAMGPGFSKALFHLASLLTTWFPRAGARALDRLIPPLLGHAWLAEGMLRKNVRVVRGLKRFGKILVIPDIHIGDAVMMQGAVSAFREALPDARIDYIVKKSAAGLFEGNPAFTHLYPCFTGTVFPTSADVAVVGKLTEENGYDLCFNGSSFLRGREIFPRGQAFLDFITWAPQLLRNEMDRSGINHFQDQSHAFIRTLLGSAGFPGPAGPFRGVPVTLSDQAAEEARSFLLERKVPAHPPIVFLNPDTASPFTLIPPAYQARILRGLLDMDCSVILGACFAHPDMGRALVGPLSPAERRRVFQSPWTMSLEAYAALIDSADVFLSGDTGPLHIAAARKVSRSGNVGFRNRTSVFSVFGATPSRMSGYDSTDPLYPPANQDAPSRTFVSESPCRNITCVNKMVKTCATPRCFEGLAVGRILAEIGARLSSGPAAAVWRLGGAEAPPSNPSVRVGT